MILKVHHQKVQDEIIMKNYFLRNTSYFLH